MPDIGKKILPQLLPGFEFRNPNLLLEALTHRSYSAENALQYDNQRLEFLGDAVLQLASTEYIFLRYKNKNEGMMSELRSALTRQETLAKFAKEIGLDKHILLGRGEIKSNGHEKFTILADAFEALIGAVYLDSGLEPVMQFLVPMLEKVCPKHRELLTNLNPKGALQEYAQGILKTKPEYKMEKTEGPEHSKIFTVSVSVSGELLAAATASSMKAAEAAAAMAAINILRDKNNVK